MAPKQDKSRQTAKMKAVEDKTFGLPNKNKSKKVQQYVNQLKSSVANSAGPARAAAAAPKDKKKLEEERQKELNALFAVAIKQPKVPAGVDPKSIVCEFFRHGQCTKGFKCKFAHDLSVERKGAKIDLFSDQRDAKNAEGQEEEGMEDWDQETLERVVKEKHGNEKPSNSTNIICKFFLEAVEKKQYGWFWTCPNGGAACKYKHALPPGYVLKSQMKELLEEEARNVRDVAEEIEEERAKVVARTPITEEVFRAWRARKVEARRIKRAAEEEERRRRGVMTGREIFMQEGFIVEDDAGANDDEEFYRLGRDEEEAAIAAMLDSARRAAAAAKAAAGHGGDMDAVEEEDEDEEEEAEEAAVAGKEGQAPGDGDHAGPSTSTGTAGPSGSAGGPAGPSTHLQLGQDDAELFDDDEDDEDDPGLDDEDEDGDGDEGSAGAAAAGVGKLNIQGGAGSHS